MFGRHFHHNHGHPRDCGPRGWSRGHRHWGPFSVEWEVGRRDERPGGRRRMFDGNELRLILLKLIADQPRHGYDLIREIEERTGGAYAPSPGVVYPTLTMLDDMGLIEEQKSEGAKKQFAITAAGQSHLAEREAEVARLMARLTELASERSRTSAGPIRRAMGNLRAVLQESLGDEPQDADRLHEIAAILDEAARKIERLQ